MSVYITTAYLENQARIADQRKILTELRKQEKQLQIDIIDYLNQNGEEGIRIDDDTVITIKHTDKNIIRNKKAFRNYLEELCVQQGLSNDDFIDAIIAGKVESTVHQSKLKLIKKK